MGPPSKDPVLPDRTLPVTAAVLGFSTQHPPGHRAGSSRDGTAGDGKGPAGWWDVKPQSLHPLPTKACEDTRKTFGLDFIYQLTSILSEIPHKPPFIL